MNFTHYQITFLRHLASGVAAEKAATQAADFFHTQHGLGQRAGSRYLYGEIDTDRARQLLINRGIALASAVQALRRSDAANNNPGNEKSGTLSPHFDSVAIKTAHGQCLLERVPVARSGYQVVTLDQANSVRTDVLLVVENLESFRFLERNCWIDFQEKSVLAVFRGDNVLRADIATRLLESRTEPVWAYFDFDPAGLGMAARLPRLERLLLPPEGILSAAARRSNQVHLFADQMAQWATTLDADGREMLTTPWRHMQRIRMGLAQEHMDALKP
ncbi:hypothetical protein J2W49_004016 [Hydrogenophaga palleronii]|uniref:DUF7281 domain-containing protein n=1 Tax=Hydrogenophaga palleronii TaxID=65655 RepID=A0ABU1WRV4_9BURK|nr:hypothetical protein [Hydrogenophaga palleronii]MDR7152040.1 hypothetical protein [Hydrogenophaga palleronii]